MKTSSWNVSALAGGGCAAVSVVGVARPSRVAKKGGILKFVVPDEPPSFDGHRRRRSRLIHPIAPFYSVLIRVDPTTGLADDFVCDLCTEMPKPSRRRQDLHLQDPQGRQVP
jgi:peptide/nickel transport system substrate-binding protein